MSEQFEHHTAIPIPDLADGWPANKGGVRDEIPELQPYELPPPFPLINDQKLLDL